MPDLRDFAIEWDNGQPLKKIGVSFPSPSVYPDGIVSFPHGIVVTIPIDYLFP
jgi:hypothetical protein